jgi:photosystem II stability/assembly factor-like uncharacterized protein
MDTAAPKERLSRRGRRALPLITLAIVVIAGTSLAYVRPQWPALSKTLTAAKPIPTPPLLSQQYLVAYDFLTASAGWALVEEATTAAPRFWVFRTTDAAKHWQRQLTATASSVTAGPLKIQFFDRNTGFAALGGTGAVYRTRDAGLHWTALTMPAFSYSSLFFSDGMHGWVLGTVPSPDPRAFDSRLFSTADGGDHWDSLPPPPAWQFAGKGGVGTFTFRSPNEGWIGGATPDRATVYSTVDGGMTWQPHSVPVTSTGKGGVPDGAALPLLETDVYVLPGSGVLAVTLDLNASPIGLTSFDGGATWRRVSPPPGETAYSDFIFQDTFHWWAMRYGTLFKSADAGQTWKQASLQLDEWDYVLQVVDAKHAWAQLRVVLPTSNPARGTGLAVTSDGGLHWTPVNVPKPS